MQIESNSCFQTPTAASRLTAQMDTVTDLLKELSLTPSTAQPADWRTKWSNACELFWQHLSRNPGSDEFLDCLETWLKLLESTEWFSLARLVITDLRTTDPYTGDNPHIRRIMQETLEMRELFVTALAKRQSDFDTAAYTDEKAIMKDADMHHARIMLFRTDEFRSDKDEELKAWWAKRPR